jgi:hypothetical protein
MNKINLKAFNLLFAGLFAFGSLSAHTDTLRVMAYNVLNYGQYPLCQGPTSSYHGYLKTIAQFANADIISLEKMGSIQSSPTDYGYTAPTNFQDSILQYALNAAYPGRYACAPFTNFAGSQTGSILFYDQQKIGFAKIVCSYSNTEDFITYKLFYKDPALATSSDTTYLYVTVNHVISGSGNASMRAAQINGEMGQLHDRFSHLANMINMGDFNVRNSMEPCYQTLTQPADTNYRYYDPPFYPDADLTYPADWDANPSPFAKYLTTSTRSSSSVPNSCGTGGGGKGWYDHIFLSPWIVTNTNYVWYIPHSFRVLGNDGNREGKAVNDAPTNTSAPAPVIEALFQMSNKYPVIADLVVTSNTAGVSPPDPEITPAAVYETDKDTHLFFENPVDQEVRFHAGSGLIGKQVQIVCTNMVGQCVMRRNILIDNAIVHIPCNLKTGAYSVSVTNGAGLVYHALIIKN